MATIRGGAVPYLNARPLLEGLQAPPLGERLVWTCDVPARLADRLAAGELDLALLPAFELGRMGGFEIVPGISIASRGPARSVLLLLRKPPQEVARVALDPESRTSNALVRILFAEYWRGAPAFSAGSGVLERDLEAHDAVLRIGDKALFEPAPAGVEIVDLGEVWDRWTGLPFVYAVWAARAGLVDRELYRALHEAKRRGLRNRRRIAEAYGWHGHRDAELAYEYLTRHLHYALGGAERRGLEAFFRAAVRCGLLESVPELRFAFGQWSACHEEAVRRGLMPAPERREA